MFFSLALIFIMGISLGALFQKLGLPRLLGLLLTGILLSPNMFDLIDESLIMISSDVRKIALIIILIKAGLSLDLGDLKAVGRPAVLMCFVPAVFEIVGIMIFAPMFFGISIIEAGLMGAVLAAVSPAVIVPKMVDLMEKRYAQKNKLPQLILAGASLDDIFVIVIFTSFLGLAQGGDFSATSLLAIPSSIVLGVIAGVAVGFGLSLLFTKIHMRDSAKVLVILALAFMLVALEDMLADTVAISGLVAVMVSALGIKFKKGELATRLSQKFSKLWVGAEIVLFVFVGATVDLSYAKSAGVMVIVLILVALCFRMVGVFVCMIKTGFALKEKLFCMISYTPKATVQAAIGGIPLAAGVASGNLILTIAVLAIIITAPVGAFMIDLFTRKNKLE